MSGIWYQRSHTRASQNWSLTSRRRVRDQFWEARVWDLWYRIPRIWYSCSHTEILGEKKKNMILICNLATKIITISMRQWPWGVSFCIWITSLKKTVHLTQLNFFYVIVKRKHYSCCKIPLQTSYFDKICINSTRSVNW